MNLQNLITMHKGLILKTAACATTLAGYCTNNVDCMNAGMALYQSCQSMGN